MHEANEALHGNGDHMELFGLLVAQGQLVIDHLAVPALDRPCRDDFGDSHVEFRPNAVFYEVVRIEEPPRRIL